MSIFLAGVSSADEKKLSAAEITNLLSGNTAVGRWIDHHYRQYFGSDGSTIYAQENTRSSVGRWRVNSASNQYESWWERSGWGSGYDIVLKDGEYFWVGSDATEPQSFVMVPGQQLTGK
ncbi:MAG: hypothetical protein AAF404_07745 [Pseudomonadota bacterium]